MMVSAYLIPHGAIYLNDLNRVKPQNGKARPAPAWDLQSLRKYVLHIRLTSLSPQQQQKPASNSDLCDNFTTQTLSMPPIDFHQNQSLWFPVSYRISATSFNHLPGANYKSSVNLFLHWDYKTCRIFSVFVSDGISNTEI